MTEQTGRTGQEDDGPHGGTGGGGTGGVGRTGGGGDRTGGGGDRTGSGGRTGGGDAGGDGTGAWKALASRYALLPLRIFLGITFVYAGLDKLTDPSFFADTGSGSIGETMRGVRDGSALPALVDLALKSPTGFGYALAFGELAVGLGTLFGLFARVAALGGALISLSLWLTVSWQASPYYLGNDLVYLMAWLPLLLAGAPVLSLDRLLAERRRIR
ncbi:DoxX family protein [Streptomyces sp. WAC08241]|uniref:DoxX family protein n=1 Tax=Streptomyces sp. WAC08241 TaxID=2487421 RepID=UPI000F7B686D|nr:DoxX family protein [Streptomyces sp. WAC08241]RSS42533.1 DoxX family protein [Streptomyces sp. WAC08241]